MAVEHPGLPSNAELARLNRAYRPVAPFASWAGLRVDEAEWDVRVRDLEERQASASSEVLRRATVTALRAAAVDTGAIEGLYQVDRGFTIAVATQAAAWQTLLQEKGIGVRDLFEAQLAGYEMALDIATQRMQPSEAWVRELHATVCRPQDTVRVWTAVGWQDQRFERGVYKRAPNHVRQQDGTFHAYAPPDQTGDEMNRFVTQLSSDEFAAARPVLQAAYAHHALTHMQPFQDGNGRVARALASVYPLRALSIPLVVFSDQLDGYYASLEQADEGSPQAFVDFVYDAALNTMRFVSDSLAANVVDRLEEIDSLLRARDGLTHAELDKLADALVDVVHEEATRQIADLRLPAGLSATTGLGAFPLHSPPPGGYRRGPGMSRCASLHFSIDFPRQIEVSSQIEVLIADEPSRRFIFRLARWDANDGLDIRLADVYPRSTTAFRMNLSAWLGRAIAEELAELKKQASSS